MKIIHIFSCILLSSVMLSGCIRDNRDSCGRTQLYFSYKGDGETDIFSQKINKVNLYVFDENEKFLFSEIINTGSLKNNLSVNLNLEPGRYSIVSIGNAYKNTEFTDLNTGRLDSIFIAHPNHLEQQRRFVSSMDSIYISQMVIDVPKDSYYMDTVSFQSSHFDLIIEIEGLEYNQSYDESNEAPVRVALMNVSPSVNFKNDSQDQYIARYFPIGNYESNQGKMKLHFQIVRQEINDNLEIVIINRNGHVDYVINCKEFIEKYNINTTKQEIVIPFLIKYTSGSIGVTIPDWAIESLDPEFE